MDTAREQSWPSSSDLVASYLHDCPARTVLEVIGNKWALLVLGALRVHDGPVRFNELRRRLDGITQKMLTQTLRALERDGLVVRAVYPTVPPRVEYSLSELGVGAGKLTAAIGAWATENVGAIQRSREDFDERMTRAPEPITGP